MPRDWGERQVCYVCATRTMDPAKCRPVNVIVHGYGVCLDDIAVIHAADVGARQLDEKIITERLYIDSVRNRTEPKG